MNDPNMWEPFAMGELSAAVNSLEVSYSPRTQLSTDLLTSCPLGIDRLTQPPVANSALQHTPPSRVPTPAPWIIGARPQTPSLRPPSTPQYQPTPPPFIHSPAPRLSTPHAGPSSALKTPSRACPRLSTSQRAAQARIQARSRHIPLPPPANSADQLLTRFPVERGTTSVLEPPPLRVSLDVPDFLRSDDEDGELDSEYEVPRPSTPITLEETDIGLDESSPIQPAIRPYCRASLWDNPRKMTKHRSGK
ncbi:hypothetical protein FRC12_005871, partial [Ceratobasidium sp. 428]